MQDGLVWLSRGVDLTIENEVNFDRSFMAVQKLVRDRVESSDDRVIGCLQRIFQLLLTSSASAAPVGLSMALVIDRLVAAAPVACTEVAMTCTSELQVADLMISGLSSLRGFAVH